MKKILVVIILLVFLMSSCKAGNDQNEIEKKYDFLDRLSMTDDQKAFFDEKLVDRSDKFIGFSDDYAVMYDKNENSFVMTDYETETRFQISFPGNVNYKFLGFDDDSNSIIYQEGYFIYSNTVVESYSLDEAENDFLEGYQQLTITYKDYAQGMMFDKKGAYIFDENMDIIYTYADKKIYPVLDEFNYFLKGYVVFSNEDDSCFIKTYNTNKDVVDSKVINHECGEVNDNFGGEVSISLGKDYNLKGLVMINHDLQINDVIFDDILPAGAFINSNTYEVNFNNGVSFEYGFTLSNEYYYLLIDKDLNALSLRNIDIAEKEILYFQNGYLILRNYDTEQLELYDTNLTLLKTLNMSNANIIAFINLLEIDDFLVISYVDVVSRDFKMYGLLKTLSYETISQGNGYVTQNAEGVYFYTEGNVAYFLDTTSMIKGEELMIFGEGFKMIQYEEYYILITENELNVVDLDFEVIDTFDIYGYIDSTVETLLVSDSDGTIYVLQLNDIIK